VVEAITLKAPAVVLAVQTDEVATPLALAVSVSVFVLFANVQLAPDDGAVKVTEAPAVGDPPVVTVATSGAANAVPTVVLCGVPLVAAMVTVGGVFLLDELQLVSPIRKITARMLQ